MNNTNKPLVSIITPTFNAARYLTEVYLSINAQTFRDFEWIIIDDGSTDNTRELIKEYAERHEFIKTVYMKVNSGPIEARNIGIRAAQGRYIAFLDADDVWLPEKLEKQVSFMINEDAGFSFHDYRHMSTDGTYVGSIVAGPEVVDFTRHHTHRDIGCLTVMVDRYKCGFEGFSHTEYNGEDFLAWAVLLRKGVVAKRVPYDLARYRLVPNSRSAKKLRKAQNVFAIYRKNEEIRFLKAAFWWTYFVINAFIKHRTARPQLRREIVDAFCKSDLEEADYQSIQAS
jgi:glycosyltransferase involved in cell wall biosynthesis